MYEPYSERGGFKIDFSDIKEKVKKTAEKVGDKVKKLDSRVWVVIGIMLLFLLSYGGYTGYTTYTGRVSEYETKVMVLEKQLDGVQQDLSNVQSSLSTCSSELEKMRDCSSELESLRNDLAISKQEVTRIKSDLQVMESKFETCGLEKGGLEQELEDKETQIADLTQQYQDLEAEYNQLESVECYYAKQTCSIVGWNYYYMKDEKVVCCQGTAVDSCAPTQPADADEIKHITC